MALVGGLQARMLQRANNIWPDVKKLFFKSKWHTLKRLRQIIKNTHFLKAPDLLNFTVLLSGTAGLLKQRKWGLAEDIPLRHLGSNETCDQPDHRTMWLGQ